VDVNFDFWDNLKTLFVVILGLWIFNHFCRLNPATQPIAGGLS